MTGQLSDFLAAHAERVADVMRRTGAEMESRGNKGDHGPRQFINAVLVALTADDLRPLTTYFDLGGEKPSGIDQRLETAISRLAARRPAAVAGAGGEMEGPGPPPRSGSGPPRVGAGPPGPWPVRSPPRGRPASAR